MYKGSAVHKRPSYLPPPTFIQLPAIPHAGFRGPLLYSSSTVHILLGLIKSVTDAISKLQINRCIQIVSRTCACSARMHDRERLYVRTHTPHIRAQPKDAIRARLLCFRVLAALLTLELFLHNGSMPLRDRYNSPPTGSKNPHRSDDSSCDLSVI